ncbi:type II 3-dehydroquinate dehydratase [Streptomyces paludis]|uniref:3-dehydroquinate dehydratase n=1 Tax=Streptomyces paludis TaxID=2282738 RepID=A0A345HRS9_9ACTN|nr:type II 3-dehydroquinate dehydratase [Streptomyces paludis]AXG79403.1 type II 3-dehydroquinate dehydratase [Streptomyces paludis]
MPQQPSASPSPNPSATPSTNSHTRVLVLNGPNLNLLGRRQPEIYGTDTLADVEKLCAETAASHGLETDFRQSNHEGQLVDWIQEAREHHAAIVINPAAYTHTSVAIRDALAACDELPIIEVHISNIHRREEFRHHSYVSAIADGVIAGCGIQGYALAVQRVARLLEQREGRP